MVLVVIQKIGMRPPPVFNQTQGWVPVSAVSGNTVRRGRGSDPLVVIHGDLTGQAALQNAP